MKMVTKEKMGGDHLLEDFEFDVAAELLDETTRDHHTSGRPDDGSLYTMGLGRHEGNMSSDSEDEQSEGEEDGKTDGTSTLTPSETETRLLDELARMRVLLESHGIQDKVDDTKMGDKPHQGNTDEDEQEWSKWESDGTTATRTITQEEGVRGEGEEDGAGEEERHDGRKRANPGVKSGLTSQTLKDYTSVQSTGTGGSGV